MTRSTDVVNPCEEHEPVTLQGGSIGHLARTQPATPTVTLSTAPDRRCA
jgi:hypothetical protein